MGSIQPRISDEQIIGALEQYRGRVYAAAKSLKADASTLYKRIKSTPELKRAFREIRGLLLDMAELNIYKAIESNDLDTSKWALARLARKRGYGDKQDVTVKGGTNSRIEIVFVEDWYGTQGGMFPVRTKGDGTSEAPAIE